MADQDGAAPAAPAPAAQRGRLEIAERVVETVARIAAAEVADVVRTGSTLESVVGRRYPKVDADVAGNRTRVQVEVAVAWPAPLATTARHVRERVAHRVAELTGFEVDVVDVTVARVVHDDDDATKEARVR